MALRENLYTADEFWKIARLPENQDRRLELDEGVIVEMASSKPINTIVAVAISSAIYNHVHPRNLGWVTTADGAFRLREDTVRQPDVGYISRVRVPKIPKEFALAPDLAVEVVSKDEDIFRKANEYLYAGTRYVWAVYPREKKVYVFGLSQDGVITSKPYGVGEMLDGGDLLPGFSLAVRDIFPA